MKSEIRISKFETNPKFKIQMHQMRFDFRISTFKKLFRISDFVLRISPSGSDVYDSTTSKGFWVTPEPDGERPRSYQLVGEVMAHQGDDG